MNIDEKLNLVFVKVFKDKKIKINSKMSAKDRKDWDSLKHIDLISSIENEFKISFSLNELSSMKNVGDITKIIKKNVNKI